MMRVAVAMAVVCLAGPALAQDITALDCTGPFARTSDEATLVKAFGRANVVKAEIESAEGATEHGTVVFPKDPKRRLEILWFDEKRRRRPASVMARGDAQGWSFGSAHPVRVGSPIADVEAANEKPFTVNGFFWDMGGYATDWKGGKLDTLPGGCSLSIRFNPDPKAKPAALKKVSGELDLSSSSAAIKGANPTVSQVSIGWPE